MAPSDREVFSCCWNRRSLRLHAREPRETAKHSSATVRHRLSGTVNTTAQPLPSGVPLPLLPRRGDEHREAGIDTLGRRKGFGRPALLPLEESLYWDLASAAWNKPQPQ